jgi:hypothetical protein
VGLGGENFFTYIDSILFTLSLFKFLGPYLDLVSLLIVLLFGHLFLDFSQVEKLG